MGGEGMGGEGGSAHPCVDINPLDGERDSGLQLCVFPSPFTGLSHRLLQGVEISMTAVLCWEWVGLKPVNIAGPTGTKFSLIKQ